MTHKTIDRLKILLVPENKAILETIVKELLSSRQITDDEFIVTCRAEKISLPPKVINNIGFAYSRGAAGLARSYTSAFKFYQWAASLNNGAGAYNCALYYFDGRATGGKDLELAYNFCQKAIKLGQNTEPLIAAMVTLDATVIEKIDAYDHTLLHWACIFNQITTVKLLVNMGADLLAKSFKGKNCLHLACEYGALPVVGFLLEKEPKLINSQDFDGMTALHWAVKNRHFSTIQILLATLELDQSLRNENGDTALDIAKEEYFLEIEVILTSNDIHEILDDAKVCCSYRKKN